MKLPPAPLQILNASTRWNLGGFSHPRPVPPGWHVEMDDTGMWTYAWQRSAEDTGGQFDGILLRFPANRPFAQGALLPRGRLTSTALYWRPVTIFNNGQWRAFERCVRHGLWIEKALVGSR